MPTRTKSRLACICGSCSHAHVGHFDPDSCRGCGASFIDGAPAALVSTAGSYDDGIRFRSCVEFTGNWSSLKKAQILAALGETEAEPQRQAWTPRIVKGGQL